MFFIAVSPLLCHSSGYICYCHRDLGKSINVYNCSSSTLTSLPESIPDKTDSLILQNNQITKLCHINYLKQISVLDLKFNKISNIYGLFFEQMHNYQMSYSLNLAENNLISIPKQVIHLDKLVSVFLGSNPYYCGCEMIWMIIWINNYTEVPGGHLVSDYKQMKCHSGKMIGKPIYQLDEVEMECYPHTLSIAQKVGIGVAATVAVLIIMLTILISKRTREVKFLMFYHLKLDTVPKDDKDEDLTNMEYDAFFCFRSVSLFV